MDQAGDDERQRLAELRFIIVHYERLGVSTPSALAGLRYRLAVRANDLNGDDCRFPGCRCAWPDCSDEMGRGAAYRGDDHTPQSG